MGLYYNTEIEITGLLHDQALKIIASGDAFLNYCIPLPNSIVLNKFGFPDTESDSQAMSNFFENERDCRATRYGWRYELKLDGSGYCLILRAVTDGIPKKEVKALINNFKPSSNNFVVGFFMRSLFEEFCDDNSNDDYMLRAEITVEYDGEVSVKMAEYERKHIPNYSI